MKEISPLHLLTTDEAEILKNVVLHSVATAFASIVCKRQNSTITVLCIGRLKSDFK